jgi:hypothetical protein
MRFPRYALAEIVCMNVPKLCGEGVGDPIYALECPPRV